MTKAGATQFVDVEKVKKKNDYFSRAPNTALNSGKRPWIDALFQIQNTLKAIKVQICKTK